MFERISPLCREMRVLRLPLLSMTATPNPKPMKQKLNPGLVRERIPHLQDRIILRAARSISEVLIGSTEVELVPELESEVAEFRAALHQTTKAIDDYFHLSTESEPHILLATNSFGFETPYRLLIYSSEPFDK